MKKIIRIIIAITVISLIGGCSKMTGSPSKEEMIRVVKSEEGKKVIEDGLKNIDKDALTDKGIIKSYEVNYDTVRHNPMGGIMFDIYVNNDRELYIKKTIVKGIDGNLTSGGGGYSSRLDKLVEESNNEKVQ